MDRVVHDLTQEIENQISAEIRRHPQYWLWSYKHWRREPGETYPQNYPDYS
jgi:lauroyl/myristoyl acyltransferase